MKSISELTKERMAIRITNPVRSSALLMLIDNACKLAKKENREVVEADIVLSANILVKEAIKDIEMYSKSSGNENVISKINDEVSVYKEFLPTLLNEQKIREIIENNKHLSLCEFTKQNKGKHMAYFKIIPNMDMKILSKVLDEILI